MKKIIALISVLTLSICAVSTNVNAASLNRPRDPNGDGVINLSDAVYIMQVLSGSVVSNNLTRSDVNQDGLVSKLDVDSMQAYILGLCTLPNARTNDVVETQDIEETVYIKHNCTTLENIEYTLFPSNTNTFSETDYASSGFNLDYDSAVVRITNQNGTNHIGSAAIIGNHTIATAAHCVYNKNLNSFVNFKIQIIFGSYLVAQTIQPKFVHIPKNFKTSNNDDNNALNDYALIYVDEDLSGYPKFNMGIALNNYISNEGNVCVSGFPASTDINNPSNYNNNMNSRYRSLGHLISNPNFSTTHNLQDELSQTLIQYTNAISGGDSGGPVYVEESIILDGETVNYKTLIGINTSGGVNFGAGIRIKEKQLRFFVSNPCINS